MSLRSTLSPSFTQTYCCFRREPSFLWSMLNEIAAFDSPAAYNCTGTETRPNETVAEPMEWAAIWEYDTRSCLHVGRPSPRRVTRSAHIAQSWRSIRPPSPGAYSRI